MKKKMLAVLLSGVLVLSSSMAASAAVVSTPVPTDGTYSAKVEGTTGVQVPTIEITVPDSLVVAINPYKMECTIDGKKVTDVLATVEQTITNESNVAIAVSATTQATPAEGAELVLAPAPLKGTETTKSVFAYLEVAEKAADGAGAAFNAEGYNSKNTNQIVFGTKAVTKKDMVVLEAPASDGDATYAGFKIMGSAAEKPAKAWTTDDKMDMSITFDFAPVASAPVTP